VFTLINPPNNGYGSWADSNSGVVAAIVGTWYYDASYGGGVQLTGDGYIEIQDITNTNATFTLSFAADFEPVTPSWNSLYSGGVNTSIFSYVAPDGSGLSAGIFLDYGSISYTGTVAGRAWWDFVYHGPSLVIYRNGAQAASGTLAFANTGWSNPLWIGARYGSTGDKLHGTIFQIRYQESALNLSQIVSQYNSQASLYALPPAPTYSLDTAGSVSSVDEGVPLTFNVSTTSVADGTTLYWQTADNFNAGTSGRFTGGSGTVTINSNAASFEITISADNTTAIANPQQYGVYLYTGNYGQYGGTQVTSFTVTVNDTSQTPPPPPPPPPPPFNPTLMSIDVSPANQDIDSSITNSVQMSATGYYDDSSNQDLTYSASWSIDTEYLSIDSTGLVTIPANAVESGTVSAYQDGVTGTTTISAHVPPPPPPPPPASVPTGNIVGRWNAPGAGQFGGDPIIWPEASGYSWAKFYHLATYSLGGNGTIGYSGDGSTSYIQTPIHMTPGDFTLAFTARLNPTGTFPQGIFDCSQSGAYAGLRAYWTDATHIEITSPGTGTAAIDMTGSGWHTYGPSFFTIRMKLDNIANTGSIDIFVNGTAWANVGAPRGANGFPATDAGTNMILGALVEGELGTGAFLESTWYNFIYYSRALSNSEVTQLYTAQQAGLFNPTPATTYSFVSNFTAGQASSNIYISIGFGGMGPTVPPDQMAGWYVSGPGISDVATVTSITNIVNDSQFTVSIDQTILQGSGTYTFTNGPAP